jgi:DNA-binding transcriptional LysR family regulator
MVRHFAPVQIALRTSDRNVIMAGVRAGLRLGFLAEHDAKERPDLVEVVSPQDDWSANLWIVTHADLHRTQKVQEFMRYLKPPRGGNEFSG